jgi:hypothetical protein
VVPVMTSLGTARALAREMIGGRLAPVEGARRIGRERTEGADHLAVFEELAGEWERDEDNREDCERRILEQASLLLADTA